jgi:hypothetical protein
MALRCGSAKFHDTLLLRASLDRVADAMPRGLVIMMQTWRTLLFLILAGSWIVLIPEPSSADSSTDSDIVFFLTSFKRLVDRFEPFSPGDLREELDAELHRDLPEAYNVEIKSQQGRLKDAISQLEEDTRKLRIYTAVLITSFTSADPFKICGPPEFRNLCTGGRVDRQKVTSVIRTLSTRLSDVVLNEISNLSQIRELVRHSQFQTLRNIVYNSISKQPGPENEIWIQQTFYATETPAAAELRLSRERAVCTATLVQLAIPFLEKPQDLKAMRAIDSYAYVDFGMDGMPVECFAPRTERMCETITGFGMPRDFTLCITIPKQTPPKEATCPHITKGSREYFRVAAYSGLQDVYAERFKLDSSTGLNLADWRLARDRWLAKVMDIIHFDLSGLVAPTECTK